MAGHSKWANIRFRKGAQDAKRAKIFTRLIRELTVASRMGGPDPGTNPRLRTAIDKAFANNMPKDNVDRAIKRGSGDLDGQILEEIRYEGYGPHGVAIMVDCMTDNRNRTVAEVRHAFSKGGGNLGTDGSVSYLFSKRGELVFSADEEKIMEPALEAGAEDIQSHPDGTVLVITEAEQFIAVKEALTAAGFEPDQADVVWSASTEVSLDQEQAEQLLKLIDRLEELDDVQAVHSNVDIPADFTFSD